MPFGTPLGVIFDPWTSEKQWRLIKRHVIPAGSDLQLFSREAVLGAGTEVVGPEKKSKCSKLRW